MRTATAIIFLVLIGIHSSAVNGETNKQKKVQQQINSLENILPYINCVVRNNNDFLYENFINMNIVDGLSKLYSSYWKNSSSKCETHLKVIIGNFNQNDPREPKYYEGYNKGIRSIASLSTMAFLADTYDRKPQPVPGEVAVLPGGIYIKYTYEKNWGPCYMKFAETPANQKNMTPKIPSC